MGFFDQILEENKANSAPVSGSTAPASVATTKTESADFLIIDDSVTIEAVPDTVAVVTDVPETANVSTENVVLFDEEDVASSVEAVTENEVVAEVQATDISPAIEAFMPLEKEEVKTSEIELLAPVAEVVEAKSETSTFLFDTVENEVKAAGVETVSESVPSLADTVKEMLEKIAKNEKSIQDKIATLTKNAEDAAVKREQQKKELDSKIKALKDEFAIQEKELKSTEKAMLDEANALQSDLAKAEDLKATVGRFVVA